MSKLSGFKSQISDKDLYYNQKFILPIKELSRLIYWVSKNKWDFLSLQEIIFSIVKNFSKFKTNE